MTTSTAAKRSIRLPRHEPDIPDAPLFRVLVVLVLLSAISACAHRYQPAEYPIADERIGPLPSGAPVRVVPDLVQRAPQVIYRAGPHSWTANLDEATVALAAQLSKELTKRGVVLSDGSPRALQVQVQNLQVQNLFAAVEGNLQLRLQLGDGEPKFLSIANKSPVNLPRALNGAIARAVLAIAADPDVHAFLAQPLQD